MATDPVQMDQRAIENLRFIRQTMERAAAFTAVPGAGGILIGLSALAAAVCAARAADARAWTGIWLAEAVVACSIGIAGAARKSRRAGLPLFSGPGRKFMAGFFPPLAAGAVLTLVMYRGGMAAALPGVWLLLYGAAMISGGASSVRIVPAMGACFMVLGSTALLVPPEWGNWFLAAGFGGLHVAFGAVITVKYGG